MTAKSMRRHHPRLGLSPGSAPDRTFRTSHGAALIREARLPVDSCAGTGRMFGHALIQPLGAASPCRPGTPSPQKFVGPLRDFLCCSLYLRHLLMRLVDIPGGDRQGDRGTPPPRYVRGAYWPVRIAGAARDLGDVELRDSARTTSVRLRAGFTQARAGRCPRLRPHPARACG